MKHVTVLETAAIDALNISHDSVVVDVTLGAGGHARHILKILDATGTYIGIDADKTALDAVDEEFRAEEATVRLIEDNFRNIGVILDRLSLREVDVILADLGWRSEQFTEGNKGFSFNDDSPLLMTYGKPEDYTFTAGDIVNEWDEEHIADVIFGYGEERQSRRIAHAIVTARADGPIRTARELASIIEGAIPKRFQSKRIHPATKTFQALRIAVNDELGAIGKLIADGIPRLRTGGRMAIITFHSIEDRLVKQLFKDKIRDQVALAVTKKPITPDRTEIEHNPRARSAKLRIIEKL